MSSKMERRITVGVLCLDARAATDQQTDLSFAGVRSGFLEVLAPVYHIRASASCNVGLRPLDSVVMSGHASVVCIVDAQSSIQQKIDDIVAVVGGVQRCRVQNALTVVAQIV